LPIASDLRESRAGLELLLADARPDAPMALKERVIELAGIVKPAYNRIEWDALAQQIRDGFGLDVFDGELVDAPHAALPFESPTNFDSLVTDGWFRDYLTYTQESEAPTQFHFGAMLACCSAAFARRPLIGWEAAPLYPNIYALVVGPTGTRKSTALAKARDIVTEAFPKVGDKPARVNVLPNEGSPQGFAGALRRRNFETSALSDGLVVASELTVLVGRDTYKSALGEWLTDWYDNMSNPWSRALKSDEHYELPSPYVCFVGASNMTWLREIPENLIKAGYLPRHLTFTAREKRHDKANPKFDATLRATLVAQLNERIRDLPEHMPLSPSAAQLMDNWYLAKITRQERLETDELFAAWLARKLPHALKVACVWQVVDGGDRAVLHEKWLRQAMALVDWMDAGVMDVYHSLGASGEGAVTESIMVFLEKKHGTATLSSVTRALRNRYNSKSVNMGVQTLMAAQLVKQEMGVGGVVLRVVTGGARL